MGARKVRRQIAEARLFQWLNGRWQGVETGPRRVDPRIAALVGLDLRQFDRVVLLPQGRFQQFLLSGTKARQELLRHLFGAGVYQRVTDMLLVRAAELRDRVAAGEQALQQRLAEASDAIDEVHARLLRRAAARPRRVDGIAARPGPGRPAPEIEGRDDAMQALESELAAAQLAASAPPISPSAGDGGRPGASGRGRTTPAGTRSSPPARSWRPPSGQPRSAAPPLPAPRPEPPSTTPTTPSPGSGAASPAPPSRAGCAPMLRRPWLTWPWRARPTRAAAADLDAARQVAAAAVSISRGSDALDAEAHTVDRRQVELAVEVAELSGRAATVQGLAAQLPAREAEAGARRAPAAPPAFARSGRRAGRGHHGRRRRRPGNARSGHPPVRPRVRSPSGRRVAARRPLPGVRRRRTSRPGPGPHRRHRHAGRPGGGAGARRRRWPPRGRRSATST